MIVKLEVGDDLPEWLGMMPGEFEQWAGEELSRAVFDLEISKGGERAKVGRASKALVFRKPREEP